MANKEKNGKSDWFDWVKALLIAFGLAFIVRMFFFAPIVVDGPSMLPTLENGDQMIVNKFIYQVSEPERFDIVVFHASAQQDFIKRVIGLPGEHVAYEDNVLYIDGEPVEEPFMEGKGYQQHTTDFTLENLPGNHETVPEGHLFVLGDNRGNSTDSRMLGVIPMEEIVGEASLIYWPPERIQLVGE
ncbi:signal peptidase I [Virgibacillus sediminis]|uniref:Signal peptidase I n=1 Tax=Virgibacillus sediminis TaxID=202260 RepID=A0ABV7AB90_9BACI